MRFCVDAKYKSIMIGDNQKIKPCYVTRLNFMGVSYAFFLLIISIPHCKFFLEKTGRTVFRHQMSRGKTFIYHGKSVLCNRTCCQSCWIYIKAIMVPGKRHEIKTSFCYNHCYFYIWLYYLITFLVITFHLTSFYLLVLVQS